MGRLSNEVALVTGGASGIGKAIALRLSEEGARVVISDVQSELGERVAREAGLEFLPHDVRSELEWASVVQGVARLHGGLSILVNSAGIVGEQGQNLETARIENWRKVFSINLEGTFFGCRAVLAAMQIAGNGSIINIGSVTSLLATPYNVPYGASKAAVEHLTKSVAQHCAERNLSVRCNVIHPGDVHTPLWDKAAQELALQEGVSTEAVLARIEANSPMGGRTEATDIAAAAAFLASDDACRITGASLMVDGGLLGCNNFYLGKYSQLLSSRREQKI